nr:flagellar basal-body MS-ring/collar protein FliF [Rubrimonas cliftonensis]
MIYDGRAKRLVKRKAPNLTASDGVGEQAGGPGTSRRSRRDDGVRRVGRIGVLWTALEPRQRLIAFLAVAAMVAAIYGVVQTASKPSYVTLYSGLDSQAIGEVAGAVEGMGVPYEMRAGSVFVPASERDRVRMALAAEGMPRNGPAGYELLDGVDGFGTTTEMFEATYWRAKEGELARTILAAPGVRSARVHIANPVGRPFQRSVEPTASVTVMTNYGPLEPAAAEAIRYLVASAVAGLTPTAVSVIDAAYGAVLKQGEATATANGETPGGARENELRREVERLLAARVGEGKAIVTVAVSAKTESERVTERVFDPQSRVAISTDSRETTENNKGAGAGGAGGAASVASNLPQAQNGGGGETTSARTETEERVNYEVSETTRERLIPAGEVERLTVAVLVDGVNAVGADGERVWSPRPEAELRQIRDLVQAAVGFDADRGDIVTVETLEFAQTAGAVATAPNAALVFFEDNGLMLAQMAILGAIALGLGLFVLRPLMRAAETQNMAPETEGPTIDWAAAQRIEQQQNDLQQQIEVDRLTLLKNTFAERRDESATVLRGWLERDVQAQIESESEAR